jgi:hypothetical protein
MFVSATSKELSSGARVEFVERETRDLKGFTQPRQLYEARQPKT